MPYLIGESFNAFLRLPIGFQGPVTDRRKTVLSLVKNR